MSWEQMSEWFVGFSYGGVRFGVGLLLQSTVLIGLSLLAGRLLRSKGAAIQSAVYRTTLVAVVLCPAASLLLTAAGVEGFGVEVPGIALPGEEEGPLPLERPADSAPIATGDTGPYSSWEAADGLATEGWPTVGDVDEVPPGPIVVAPDAVVEPSVEMDSLPVPAAAPPPTTTQATTQTQDWTGPVIGGLGTMLVGLVAVGGKTAEATASQPSEALPEGFLGPIDVVASPDGGTLYVAAAAARRIAKVDARDGKVLGSIAVTDEPTGLVLSPDGTTLYVTSAAPEGRIHPVDVISGEVGPEIMVGHGACGPAISPDGEELYVCNRFDNNVAVVDLRAGKTTLVPATREPLAAAVTPDGESVFVINHLPLDRADGYEAAAVVTAIDPASYKTRAIRLPNGSTCVRGICTSPDGKYVYATHILSRYQMPTTQVERGWMNTNALSIIDARRKKLINTVLLDDVDRGAANPWGVACTADGKTVCVTHAGTHELSVIDAEAVLKKLSAMPEKRDPGDRIRATRADVPNDLDFRLLARIRGLISAMEP